MKLSAKKVISLLLSLVTVCMLAVPMAFPASAALQTSLNRPEDSGDYAYWNGSKMVCSSSTQTTEIKWMQTALNYCITNLGLNATKLTVDGSFGPATKSATIAFQKAYGLTADGSFGPDTIKKMKNVVDNDVKPKNSSSNTSSSKITTAQIQKILDKYNYVTGRYWTYKKNGSNTSSYQSTTRAGRSYSYYYNGVECYGFANFVMSKVTTTEVCPANGNKNGWKKIAAKDVTELKVGDIVRIGKSDSNGHSGIVLTVDGNGTCTFAQCFGGVDNRISIGTKLSSSNFGSHSTLKSMKNNGVLCYVYRYVG